MHDTHDHDRHDHGHGHAFDAAAFDSPAMVAQLELEGEVLLGLVAQATAVLAGAAGRRGVDVRRVLDLGCGPGVGTCHLAERFSTATVVAVDGSPAMLGHAARRAERLGVAGRVETRAADLAGAGLDALPRADVVWASMALHHVGDEVAALRRFRRLLEPGGLLAVIERADPPRILVGDDDLGRPGLWARLDAAEAAWFAGMRATLDDATPSGDVAAMLGAAGLDVLVEEVLTLTLDAPLDERARRFAHRQLVRSRAQLAPHADADDLDALDALIDEDAETGVLRRADAALRASRHLYVAAAAPA